MAAKTFTMTAAGKAELEAELEQLKTEGRVDIAEKLKVARSYGDLSENSEYDEAKSEQAKIEARICLRNRRFLTEQSVGRQNLR